MTFAKRSASREPGPAQTTIAPTPRAMIRPGRARRWISTTLGVTQPASEGERRHARVAQAALSAAAVRAVGVGVSLLTVHLTVDYLGAERYGAWMTISAILAWLQLADFGVGNSLTNAIADAYGRNRPDVAQAHIATAFWLLAATGAGAGAAIAAAWPFVDWSHVLNVTGSTARAEIGAAVALATACFLANFPLSIVERIYAARQQGVLANLWSGGAHVICGGAVFLATRTHGGMVALVTAYSGARLLVTACSAAWLFASRRSALLPRIRLVNRESTRRLWRAGVLYLVVQLAGLLLFSTDNIIISRLLGPAQVTPYSVSWRLFTLPSMIVTLSFPYLWPAYADAFARCDFRWVRRTFVLSTSATTVAAAACAIPLLIFGETIISRWAGPAATPPRSLLIWMATWSVIYSFMNSLACFLNGAGHIRGQAIYGSATAVANIGLSIWWGQRYGITGVIAATVTAFAVCGVLPSTVEAVWVLRRTTGAHSFGTRAAAA